MHRPHWVALSSRDLLACVCHAKFVPPLYKYQRQACRHRAEVQLRTPVPGGSTRGQKLGSSSAVQIDMPHSLARCFPASMLFSDISVNYRPKMSFFKNKKKKECEHTHHLNPDLVDALDALPWVKLELTFPASS